MPIVTVGEFFRRLVRVRRRLRRGWAIHRRRLLELWIIGIAASLGVTLASALGYLDAVQARSLDALMRLRRATPVSDVVIVAIDNDAFDRLGQRQPLPRDHLARVLRGLDRAGVAVVGLDISLSAQTENDAALARAIAELADDGLSKVVTVTGRPAAGPLAEPSLIARTSSGVPDVQQDADGVIRRTSLAVRRDTRVVPTFALAVVARVGGLSGSELERTLERGRAAIDLPVWRPDGSRVARSGPDTVMIAPDAPAPINFVGPAGTFLTIPSGVVAALADPAADVASNNPLRGRIALVGATFADSRDFYRTPHGLVPGVEVHANIVHMLGTRTMIERSGWFLGFAIQTGIVVLAGVVIVLVNPWVGIIAATGGALMLGLPASYLVFARGHHWVDFMLPVAAMRVMAWGVDLVDRPDVRDMFERHVRLRIARILGLSPTPRRERRDVSLLRVTLRGFALDAETMASQDIAARLATYRTVVERAVRRQHGTVYPGVDDSIVAVFGALSSPVDHALRAVLAARAIDAALRHHDARHSGDGTEYRPRILVHSGGVFAGTVGNGGPSPYAVLGSAADLTARLGHLCEDLDAPILITEQTCAALADRVQVSDRGLFSVRGHGIDVRLYEFVGMPLEESDA